VGALAKTVPAAAACRTNACGVPYTPGEIESVDCVVVHPNTLCSMYEAESARASLRPADVWPSMSQLYGARTRADSTRPRQSPIITSTPPLRTKAARAVRSPVLSCM
jgi:hypothetical protein